MPVGVHRLGDGGVVGTGLNRRRVQTRHGSGCCAWKDPCGSSLVAAALGAARSDDPAPQQRRVGDVHLMLDRDRYDVATPMKKSRRITSPRSMLDAGGGRLYGALSHLAPDTHGLPDLAADGTPMAQDVGIPRPAMENLGKHFRSSASSRHGGKRPFRTAKGCVVSLSHTGPYGAHAPSMCR